MLLLMSVGVLSAANAPLNFVAHFWPNLGPVIRENTRPARPLSRRHRLLIVCQKPRRRCPGLTSSGQACPGLTTHLCHNSGVVAEIRLDVSSRGLRWQQLAGLAIDFKSLPAHHPSLRKPQHAKDFQERSI